MAKIGSKVQETRLRKGLTLDRIADDTNISVRFLSKIENDDFTGFPGEPYVVGFIRNYAEYLGLDPEAVVATYRNKGDEPPPPAEVDTAMATMPSSERIQQQTLEPSATASAKTRAGSTAVASADSEPATASGAAIETAGDEMEKVAPKPRKSRKPKATAPANALEPAATTPSPVPRKPFERKTGGEVKATPIPAAESRPRKGTHRHRPFARRSSRLWR